MGERKWRRGGNLIPRRVGSDLRDAPAKVQIKGGAESMEEAPYGKKTLAAENERPHQGTLRYEQKKKPIERRARF